MFLPSYVVPRTQRLRAWTVFGLVVGLVMLSEFVGLATPVRSLGEQWWGFWTARINQVSTVATQPFVNLQTLVTTQRRLRDLEVRYAQSLAQITELEQYKQENEALRGLLNSGTTINGPRIITSPIIAYGRPLIAAGSRDNVQPGMMVLMAETLLGVVTEVSDNQSQVALLHQEQAPHILAKTETGVTGIVRGNGQRVVMTEVPIEQNVSVGQRVMTQGQDGIAPNIMIGTVAEVRSQPTSAVQTLVIEQIVSFYEATILEIR